MFKIPATILTVILLSGSVLATSTTAPVKDITPAVAPLLASAQTTMAKTVSNKYVLATDDDFAGNLNAEFRYIGSAEYVIIPHTIKGAEVTSYNHMFENTKVKGVYSDNPNIEDFGLCL